MGPMLLRPTFIVSLLAALLIGDSSAEPHEEKNACLLPRDRGDPTSCGAKTAVLGASVLRFYYDRATQHCQPFTYLGCGGNGNKFETLTACKAACSGAGSGGDVAEGHDGHAKVVSVPKCDGGVRVAVNEASQPVDCSACPNGYECQSSQKQCCPTRTHTCSLEYDTGKYVSQGSHTPRYFYNKAVNNCLLFTYYGALGNANNFETYNECVNFCSTGAKSNQTVIA